MIIHKIVPIAVWSAQFLHPNRLHFVDLVKHAPRSRGVSERLTIRRYSKSRQGRANERYTLCESTEAFRLILVLRKTLHI